MEEFILRLHSLSPALVYIALFAIAFTENVFPPSPSDLVVVLAGAMVSFSQIGFVEALAASSAGSVLGFLLMFKIGGWFGAKILERGKLKFVSQEGLRRVEAWFKRYGYWIIVVNRFLAGTRAVVSFFAGLSGLDMMRTTILSFLSACLWNSLLLAGGYYVGSNRHVIHLYLTRYSQVVTGIVLIVALAWGARYLYHRRKSRAPAG